MYAGMLKAALCLFCLVGGVVWLIAQGTVPREKAAQTDLFAAVGFESAPDWKKQGLSIVFDEPKFPRISVTEVPQYFGSIIDTAFEQDVKKLRKVVPLGSLSRAGSRPREEFGHYGNIVFFGEPEEPSFDTTIQIICSK